MKWYWILLIVLGVIAISAVITMALKSSKKSKASLPAQVKAVVDSTIKHPVAPSTTVSTNGNVAVANTNNADGTKTVSIERIGK